jgi:hypothetical protein
MYIYMYIHIHYIVRRRRYGYLQQDQVEYKSIYIHVYTHTHTIISSEDVGMVTCSRTRSPSADSICVQTKPRLGAHPAALTMMGATFYSSVAMSSVTIASNARKQQCHLFGLLKVIASEFRRQTRDRGSTHHDVNTA